MLDKKTCRGLAVLARPIELSKTLGNMLFGATLALYAAYGVVTFSFANVGWFLWGFVSLGMLWAGLYALNDFTDWKQDALHSTKKKRPIPSGAVKPEHAFFFSMALIVTSIALASQINAFFLAAVMIMFFNQLAYTYPPLSLKKRPILDLISGSLINPFFRFYAGWFLFQQSFGAPMTMLLFVVLIQFAGYALYRLSTRTFEKKLSYQSSVTLFGEKAIKRVAYAGGVIAILAFVAAPLTGVLPMRFLWLVILSFVTLPWYWGAVKKPESVYKRKTYSLLYWHNIAFIVGYLLLWLV